MDEAYVNALLAALQSQRNAAMDQLAQAAARLAVAEQKPEEESVEDDSQRDEA